MLENARLNLSNLLHFIELTEAFIPDNYSKTEILP